MAHLTHLPKPLVGDDPKLVQAWISNDLFQFYNLLGLPTGWRQAVVAYILTELRKACEAQGLLSTGPLDLDSEKRLAEILLTISFNAKPKSKSKPRAKS